MTRIALITDSTSDLPKDIQAESGAQAWKIPLAIQGLSLPTSAQLLESMPDLERLER